MTLAMLDARIDLAYRAMMRAEDDKSRALWCERLKEAIAERAKLVAKESKP